MNENQPSDSKRRTVIQWLTSVFLSLWGVALVGAVASYLRPPETPRAGGRNLISGGDAASLAPGSARLIRHGNEPIYVIRLLNEELVAVSALCTHFRCVLNWRQGEMILSCPCHDGTFNQVGEVMSGLPTRALRTYEVDERGGQISVRV